MDKPLHDRHAYLRAIHDDMLLDALEGDARDETAYKEWIRSSEGRELACLDWLVRVRAEKAAPGYMDCTEWNYGKNKHKLAREVRQMYGC